MSDFSNVSWQQHAQVKSLLLTICDTFDLMCCGQSNEVLGSWIHPKGPTGCTCLTHLVIWSLKLKLNFKPFLSNKTLSSFILTCSGVIPNQWGSEPKHGEDSSRQAHAPFSPLFFFGQGTDTFSSSPHCTQAGVLSRCFLEKATRAVQAAPISSSQAVTSNVSADPSPPQAPPHCSGPVDSSQPCRLSTGITPHQGFGKSALTSVCSKFRLTLRVLQGIELPAISVEL